MLCVLCPSPGPSASGLELACTFPARRCGTWHAMQWQLVLVGDAAAGARSRAAPPSQAPFTRLKSAGFSVPDAQIKGSFSRGPSLAASRKKGSGLRRREQRQGQPLVAVLVGPQCSLACLYCPNGVGSQLGFS